MSNTGKVCITVTLNWNKTLPPHVTENSTKWFNSEWCQ